MAATVQEIHELLYGIDGEKLRELMVEGSNAIKQVVLNKFSEEGIDIQPFMNAWNAFVGKKLDNELEDIKEPKKNTVPAIAATASDVQQPVNNVKHEKTSIALNSINEVRPMPPPRKPAPRTKKIKSEPLDEPHGSTRSKSARSQNHNKESVIIRVPDIPLIDLTNNCISPRRTRSKIRQATTQVNENIAVRENSMTQLYKKNNLSETVENMNTMEDNEEETKGNQRVNANSPSPDVDDESKNKKRGIKETDHFLQPLNNFAIKSSKATHGKINQKIESQPISTPSNNKNYNGYKSPAKDVEGTIIHLKKKLKSNSFEEEVTKDEQVNATVITIETKDKPSENVTDDTKNLFVHLNETETKTDLNQTYTLSSKPQNCNISVSVKQPPKEMNTPTKPNKLFTPLKNSKTQIPKFTKSPSSSSTPLSTYKPSQKILRPDQKQKEQESLQKKDEVLQALEKNNIKLQKGYEMKKEAEMKQEAARKLMDKTKAKEYLKKKQEGMVKANPGNGGSSKKEGKELTYLTKETPLLPTVDCYDSDEEHKQPNCPQYPTWTQSRLLEREELVGNTTGKMNTLFIKNIVTPDLQEVFEYIDAKKLVRSSSAHWKEPPRYTLFNVHNTFYFSEDEDI